MKKNYTLKLVLAMLIVVLVSLVSFVGVYKGKNLLKEYTLGKDFSQRKIATYSIAKADESEKNENSSEGKEDDEKQDDSVQSEENNAEQAEGDVSVTDEENKAEESNDTESNNEEEKSNEAVSEEQKKKDYNTAKNNISKRLTAMKSEEYDIRLDDETGKLVIEVPASLNSTYLSEIVSKGKVQIKNTNSNEVIIDGNGFKDAKANIDTTSYSKPIVTINLDFTKEAKKKLNEVNKNYSDEDGNEKEATFGVTLDGETLYSDTASTFVNSANEGRLSLVLGQSDEGEALQEDYQRALAITAIIKCGEIPVEYEINSIEIASPTIAIKEIVFCAVGIGIAILVVDVIRCKAKCVLPVISLVGLVASILLVLRYTNVKITMFTLLALFMITVLSNSIIVKTILEKKPFKEVMIKQIISFIPCLIIAIVFCCTPYLQLASFGMTVFWGLIVMCIYCTVITRVFIEK